MVRSELYDAIKMETVHATYPSYVIFSHWLSPVRRNKLLIRARPPHLEARHNLAHEREKDIERIKPPGSDAAIPPNVTKMETIQAARDASI